LTISKVNFEGKGGKIAKPQKKTEKKRKTMKKVREKVPFDKELSKVNFEGTGGKKQKQKKGFEKKLLLTISKVKFEGKGGKLAKTKKRKYKTKIKKETKNKNSVKVCQAQHLDLGRKSQTMDSCKPSCRSSSFFGIISPHQRLKILKS
jgi:hypothetical protein